MNVMITGANGFIGSRLCDFFAINSNNTVYALVKDINEDVSMFTRDNIKIVYCDLLESKTLRDKLNVEIDIFYNLAWIGVSTSLKNNFDLQYLNIQFCYNAISIAKELHAKKFIGVGSMSEFAYSSAEITGYGVPSPSDFYSVAKVSSRYFCEIFAEQNDIDFNWTFITSIYGPGRNDDNVITYTIKKLLSNETPQYTGLEQKWDYIYIDDVINALFLVGTKGVNKKYYTIGSGFNMKLKDYIMIIKNNINPNAKIEIGKLPYKTMRIDNSIVDISEFVSDTGFKANFTFDEGIQRTIEYFKKVK